MPINTILADPNPLHLAVNIERPLTVGGTFLLPGLPQGWNSAIYTVPASYNVGANSLRKLSVDGGPEVITFGLFIPANQPWMTEFSFSDNSTNALNPFDVSIGVRDNLGHMTGFQCYRYPPETQERYNILAQGLYPFGYPTGYLVGSHNDRFQLASDGRNIQFLHLENGAFVAKYTFAFDESILYWRFFYSLFYHGNYVYDLLNRVNDAVVPVNTLNTTISTTARGLEIRIIDISHFGIKALAVNQWVLSLSNDYIQDELLLPADSTALYITPRTGARGTTVVQGQIVQFDSNGGNSGLFEATGGTILPDLRWQAPFSNGLITFTYTIGNVHATTQLTVVPELAVEGVTSDGFHEDIVQGQGIQFTSNCPTAIFRCLNFPSIITTTGFLVAPTDAYDTKFGEKTCNIQVSGCGQTFNFKIHIQALYPVPRYCGPTPTKWTSPLIKDYLPNTVTMTGGTSQVKNKNKSGILTWEIEYQNLRNSSIEGCTCADPLTHTEGCDLELESASRMDAFYNLVKLTNYFSVLDYHLGIVYKYVRLTKYTGNHNLFDSEQTRSVTMRQEGDVLFE